MALPLPIPSIDGARVVRYRYRIARKLIPGGLDCWLDLAEGGGPLHLRFAEVRGFLDQGLCGATLSGLSEIAASPFAKGLSTQPVFEASQPGRVFRWEGELNSRGIATAKGEVVATAVKVMDPSDACPIVQTLAAPIPWDQALPVLEATRLLAIEGYAEQGVAVAEIRAGSPRGEYALKGAGLELLQDSGYPADRAVAKLVRSERVVGGWRLELTPTKQKSGDAPLVVEAAELKVQRVVK